MASPADSSCWRFEALVGDIAEPLTTTQVPSPSNHSSRILLVETNTPPSQYRQQQQRMERLTLQEVAHSPTYYDTASLSYQTSYASTLSTASRPPSISPPPSPTVTTTRPHRPSWTASMESSDKYFPPIMVGNDSIPLGWLRPSLSPTALLDINQSATPSHFVFLGFGNTELLTALFGLKGTWDSDTLCERSFFFHVDDEQKAMATLVTPGNDTSYLENLMLNRIGITSILVTFPAHATVPEIRDTLDQITRTFSHLDPQGTWWQRLILIFHHDTLDDRCHLVHNTLPSLILPIAPCVCLVTSSLSDQPIDYHHQSRRLLYQQACMHQTDLGWWHGSTALTDESSDSSEDDCLLPVAVMVGNKKVVKKKKPLFTVDPVPQVGLHRFSKKWSEPPRRHHTNSSSSSRTSRFNPPIPHTF